MEYRFVADVHAGKLARLLRMMGFDTVYNNTFTKAQLIQTPLIENRILLSRNIAFNILNTVQSYIVNCKDAYMHLQQVIKHFNIKAVKPFTRCIMCNGILQAISKEEILNQLQPN